MNFIKRAWLATKAKKGRTALLTLVTSSILIFVLAGLTIKSAADKAVDNAKKEAVRINSHSLFFMLLSPLKFLLKTLF